MPYTLIDKWRKNKHSNWPVIVVKYPTDKE